MRHTPTIQTASILLLAAAAGGQTTPSGAGAGTLMTQTLILTGDPSPDGNGTVQSFGSPTINNKGEVAVVLSFSDTQNPPLDYSGVFLLSSQSATTLVRGGDPSPDGNGVFEYFGYDSSYPELVVVNDNGNVAFAAYLDQTVGVGGVDSSGIFGANATDGVTKYVRNTDPAPDGNGAFGLPAFGPWDRSLSLPGLDNNDQASFSALFNGTSGGFGADDNGIFRADDISITKLLRAGQPEPFGPDTVLFVGTDFGSNSPGQVAMVANIGSPKSPGRSGDGGPTPDVVRVYVANDVLLEEVFTAGGAPPDGDGVIGDGIGRTRIADNGHLTLQLSVTGTVDPLHWGKRLFTYDGVILQEIVRQGAIGPGETDPFRFSSYPGLDSNIHDEVVFSAILERNAVPPDNRTTAIYRWKDGDLSVAVHQGDPAPDGNGTFGDLARAVFLNNGGQIAFFAGIEGSTPPPPATFDFGIFVIDSSGTIHQAARTGQPLAGSTILSPWFIGSANLPDSDLRVAGMNAINDSGEVTFWAGLGDGTQAGLFVWASPEVTSLDMEDGTFGNWDVSP